MKSITSEYGGDSFIFFHYVDHLLYNVYIGLKSYYEIEDFVLAEKFLGKIFFKRFAKPTLLYKIFSADF